MEHVRKKTRKVESVRRSPRFSVESGLAQEEPDDGRVEGSEKSAPRRQVSPIPFGTDTSSLVLHSCNSPKIIREEFGGLDSVKESIVKEIGLGGLMLLPDIKFLDRGFSLWLLRRLDPKEMKIIGGGSIEIAVQESDVSRVLGICSGKKPVPTAAFVDTMMAEVDVKKLLKVDQLSISNVRRVFSTLKNKPLLDAEEKGAFRASSVLLAFAYFLWANSRGCATICKDVLESVRSPETLHEYNWAEYILRTLRTSAIRVKDDILCGSSSLLLGGCIFFLQLLYLDSLDFGASSISSEKLPRVVAYTPEKIRQLIRLDKINQSSGAVASFGRTKTLRTSGTGIQSKGKQWADGNTRTCGLGSRKEDIFMGEGNWKKKIMTYLAERDMKVVDEFAAALERSRQDFFEQVGMNQENGNRKGGNIDVRAATMGPAGATVDGYHRIGGMRYKRCARRSKEGSKRTVEDCTSDESYIDPKRKKEFISTEEVACSIGLKPEVGANKLSVFYIDEKIFRSLAERIMLDSDGYMKQDRLEGGMTGSRDTFSTPERKNGGIILTVRMVDKPQHRRTYGYSRLAENPPFPFGRNRIGQCTIVESVLYTWVMCCSGDELNREWIVQMRAGKELKIKGAKIQKELSPGSQVGCEIAAMIFRVLERQDHELYKYGLIEQCRHYISPEWGEHVLIQGDYIEKVEGFFTGGGAGYDPRKCELFIAPVSVEGRWVCYFWDIDNKCINVIDPVMMTESEIKLKEHHEHYTNLLHRGFLYCKERYFPDWDISECAWCIKYMSNLSRASSKSESFFHVVHYAMHFDGAALHYPIDYGYSWLARMHWLHQMLHFKWNSGHLPSVMCVGVD